MRCRFCCGFRCRWQGFGWRRRNWCRCRGCGRCWRCGGRFFRRGVLLCGSGEGGGGLGRCLGLRGHFRRRWRRRGLGGWRRWGCRAEWPSGRGCLPGWSSLLRWRCLLGGGCLLGGDLLYCLLYCLGWREWGGLCHFGRREWGRYCCFGRRELGGLCCLCRQELGGLGRCCSLGRRRLDRLGGNRGLGLRLTYGSGWPLGGGCRLLGPGWAGLRRDFAGGRGRLGRRARFARRRSTRRLGLICRLTYRLGLARSLIYRLGLAYRLGLRLLDGLGLGRQGGARLGRLGG